MALNELCRRTFVVVDGYMEITLANELFCLLPQKALFRPLKKQLIVSDVHLGKATHFRKKGIPLPGTSHFTDIDRFDFLIRKWQPRAILILGDLFHSEYNREWLLFQSFVKSHPNIEFVLVEGNHDILSPSRYELENLLIARRIDEPKLVFSHEPWPAGKKTNVCGHIHPGVRLTGKARQSVTLPCFYQREYVFMLPAFGGLTGLTLMDPMESKATYVVTHETVVKL